jgi:hypothetical protein
MGSRTLKSTYGKFIKKYMKNYLKSTSRHKNKTVNLLPQKSDDLGGSRDCSKIQRHAKSIFSVLEYFLQTYFAYKLVKVPVAVDIVLPTTDFENSYYVTFEHFQKKLPEKYTTMFIKVKKITFSKSRVL